MGNVDRKWLPPTLIALAAVASALVYTNVPSLVDVPLGGAFPFHTLRPAQPVIREVALFGIPALALLVWAGFRIAPTALGQRFGRTLFASAPESVTSPEQFDRFGSTYETIVFGVVLLLVGVHAAVLAAALQHPDAAARLVGAAVGVALLIMGNVMPRLRPNWVAGLRTRRLLEDPQLWRTVHRTFGSVMVTAGIMTIVVAVVAPSYGLIAGLAGLLASLIVGGVASTRARGGAVTAVLLAGVLIGAPTSPADAQAPQAITPVLLTPPASVVDTPFAFVSIGLTLKSTLTVPRSARGKPPVVLIVAGSGPTDRHANGPLINSNAYAMLAWGLAEHGIASLRYDKRGIGESGVTSGDPTKLLMDDYVADVATAVASLTASNRFSTLFLLSPGSIMCSSRSNP